MIRVTRNISLDENEISFRFVRASRPRRLGGIGGKRLSAAGILIIDARRHRSQERNRADAVARLIDLIAKAAVPPRPRHKTKPTKASRERRLGSKRRPAPP